MLLWIMNLDFAGSATVVVAPPVGSFLLMGVGR